MDLLKDKAFLFVHIPKTGGVTFHNILVEQFAWKARKTFIVKEDIAGFKTVPLEKKLKYKLIKGHFVFSDDSFFPRDKAVFFTFFREPTARLISHYFYFFQNPRHWFHKEMIANNYTMQQMLENGKVQNLDNCMVRFLSGSTHKPYGEINEDDLQLAIQNFDQYFYHFGINEYYDESLLILAHQMGWKTPHYLQLNKGVKKTRSTFDEATTQLMNRYNQFDKPLYEHALKKFKLKLEEYKDLLDKELPGFREKNKTHSTLRLKLFPFLGSRVLR